MTIGVVTVAYGSAYQRFLPEWAGAVAALERQPDKVTIICDDISGELIDILENTLKKTYTKIMLTPKMPEYHPQILVNDAIAATQTDWICKMDVDDRFLPHALNKVDECEADILMFGIMLTQCNPNGTATNNRPTVMLPQKVSSENILAIPHNLVFSGSPFRKNVWEAAPFRDMIYEDWAFWIEAAKNGFTFTQTDGIEYEYRVHGANVSMHCNDQLWRDKVLALRDCEENEESEESQ